MTWDFTSLVTVFQSYQDSRWMIMNGDVQWNPDYNWKESHHLQASNVGLLDQQTNTSPTKLPGLCTKRL